MSDRTIAYQPALDGLRALAVIAVVLYHAGATSGLPGLAPGGFLGVSVFFTLSGFLVTTLLIRLSSSPSGLDIQRFWTRRVKRLVPVSLTMVVLAVLLSSRYWAGMQAGDAAAGIFGYTNWHVIGSGEDALLRTIVGPLGPFWSLAVEEQFYVLLTVAVLLAWRTARPIRTLTIVVVSGWLVSVAVQIVTAGPQFRLEFGTDARGAELLAGCGLALLLHVRPTVLIDRAKLLAPAGAASLGILVVLAATTDYDPPWLLRGGYGAVSLVSAVLVASLMIPGPLTRALSTPPVVAVGRLSYSWYVIHWPVILIVNREIDTLDRWALVGVKVAASLAAAFVLHHAVEQPLRRVDAAPSKVGAVWAGSTVAALLLALAML
ncbi:acyltransferase family protein [Ilumatobacter coccineus]|uniref:Putative acyltransferase n=1 Tax=Ilumatobacter coccineus (strain NBRC 103263 / KCTC 29153 / YM16-304) TaxID=1313172 RepID=A0A6C7ECI0_ILUCY|nr:acyltransferase [Ilumatobacter coccineus]BAN02835.1 putative acyltransferase [Ilumatobacter coccineus YM16-304]